MMRRKSIQDTQILLGGVAELYGIIPTEILLVVYLGARQRAPGTPEEYALPVATG